MLAMSGVMYVFVGSEPLNISDKRKMVSLSRTFTFTHLSK